MAELEADYNADDRDLLVVHGSRPLDRSITVQAASGLSEHGAVEAHGWSIQLFLKWPRPGPRRRRLPCIQILNQCGTSTQRYCLVSLRPPRIKSWQHSHFPGFH